MVEKNIVLGSMVVMGENAAALLEAVAKMVWGSFHQVIVLVMKLMQGSFKKGCHGGGLLMLLFVLLMAVVFFTMAFCSHDSYFIDLWLGSMILCLFL